MLKIKYTLPKNETQDDSGKVTRTSETVLYDENSASTEILTEEVRKLLAQGYEVTANLTVKMPKE